MMAEWPLYLFTIAGALALLAIALWIGAMAWRTWRDE